MPLQGKGRQFNPVRDYQIEVATLLKVARIYANLTHMVEWVPEEHQKLIRTQQLAP